MKRHRLIQVGLGVAWAALFALLAIWSYVGWVRRRSPWRWAGALGLYGLSLLAKPAHFALPFLLLLSRDLKRSARRLAGVAVVGLGVARQIVV